MNSGSLPFTNFELAFIGLYILSLIYIGWLGMQARKESTMKDFYLAGRGIGFAVLLLTLYATQYSGNTLFAFTSKAYKIGFSWLVCVHFMTAIVVCYLLFAPQLYRLAKERSFITPADFLQYRYQYRPLKICASIIMVIALANYLLAQLKAMGEALKGFSPEHPVQAYTYGVIALAVIIVVYESLGGFRAVAWTDVIQGSVLMIGFVVLIGLVFWRFGSIAQATQVLTTNDMAMVLPPGATSVGSQVSDSSGPVVSAAFRPIEWISWVLIVGFGGALYPQAIQRIYAARSARSLRHSLAVMAFLPLTTTLIAVIFGVIAAATPNLNVTGDDVLTVVCREIQQTGWVGRGLVVVLFAAILAALMSTADSVLLSMSSMLTKDVYADAIRPAATQRELTLAGKFCSWSLIAVATAAAIALRETELIAILKVKFEILVQLAPSFILGLHWKRLRGGPVLAGLLAGVILGVSLTLFVPKDALFGIHAGLYGLAVNLAICLSGSIFIK